MITHTPTNVEEASDVLKRGERVTFVGGGTHDFRPIAVDAEVRTDRMNRILDYAPADMVITAEAGVTIAQLQNAAREHRQMLALDPPNPERSTIGGVVATGAFGPRRARYGSVRDLIIGVTLVRSDGVIARGGGKVVKNVAGFDLPKVACGSMGTLAMIASATFRLHPLPEMSRTVVHASLTPDEVVARVKSARDKQLEPVSVVAIRNLDGRYDLAFRFEGFKVDAGPISTPDFWTRHDAVRTGGPLRIKVASLPTRFPIIDRMIAPLFRNFVWYATLGIGFACSDARPGASDINDIRRELVASGGSLVIEKGDVDLDPWGPIGPEFALMKELKSRFDPDRRFNPGRFVGGL